MEDKPILRHWQCRDFNSQCGGNLPLQYHTNNNDGCCPSLMGYDYWQQQWWQSLMGTLARMPRQAFQLKFNWWVTLCNAISTRQLRTWFMKQIMVKQTPTSRIPLIKSQFIIFNETVQLWWGFYSNYHKYFTSQSLKIKLRQKQVCFIHISSNIPWK